MVQWLKICRAMQEILVHSLVRKQRSHVPWSNLSCPLQLINLRATTRESTHFIERMQQLRPNTNNKINIFFRKRISNWRWGRNRTGRPLSLPQIHQKIIWMLSNYHKTTSEHWQRTPGTQKGGPFSLKGDSYCFTHMFLQRLLANAFNLQRTSRKGI